MVILTHKQMEDLAEILKKVSEASGIEEKDIKGKSQKDEFLVARQITCFIACNITDHRGRRRYSYTRIGKEICRNRTTIHRAAEVVKDMLYTRERKYVELYNKLME